jgi:hypothetical protein
MAGALAAIVHTEKMVGPIDRDGIRRLGRFHTTLTIAPYIGEERFSSKTGR